MQKILIVEDEEVLANVLKKKLEDSGYNAVVTSNGDIGLQKIYSEDPDLILLDIILPKLSGFDILESLHKDHYVKPIIIISNSGQPVEIERAKQLGVKDFLIKAEFSPEEVLEKVQAQLAAEAAASNNQQPPADASGNPGAGEGTGASQDNSASPYVQNVSVLPADNGQPENVPVTPAQPADPPAPILPSNDAQMQAEINNTVHDAAPAPDQGQINELQLPKDESTPQGVDASSGSASAYSGQNQYRSPYDAAAQPEPQPAAPTEPAHAQPNGKRVMVVEDDQFLRTLITRKLKTDGFDVVEAIDGNEAIKKSQEEKVHIILLDLILPGIDGFEVLHRLKENPSTINVPVIILSNLGQKDDIDRGIELGAKDFLIKAHFTPEEIIEKIKVILSQVYGNNA